MFLIAGIQPKTKKLEKNSRLCPNCGLKTANMLRVDHYFSLFFLPLVRVKKGQPNLVCDRCHNAPTVAHSLACRHCGRSMDMSYKFCPHCGKSTHQ